MGSLSIWHWLILGTVAMLAFGGKGKISSVMGDVADGIKAFKKGKADDSVEARNAEEQKAIEARNKLETGSGSANKVG